MNFEIVSVIVTFTSFDFTGVPTLPFDVAKTVGPQRIAHEVATFVPAGELAERGILHRGRRFGQHVLEILAFE